MREERRLDTRAPGGTLTRRWILRSAEGALSLASAIAEAYPALGRSRQWVARLLANRGVTEPETALAFLGAALSRDLRSPLLMKDMRRATMRIADAVRANERIVVFSDYDVDGISGSAQLLNFLRELGLDAGVYVPSRLREGYGLNEGAVRQLAAEGAQVLITVDCGSANIRELALARALGMDVIVCDHHHVAHERPPACAVLNPHQADCTFPFKGLSGAGVAFYLLMGLRMELRERGVTRLPDLRRYLDLVTLGTVGDVMPLREENRVLVKHGLQELGRTTRPGIAALREIMLVDEMSVRAVGFRLAPVLNASGRLADARRAIELLTTESLADARITAARLEEDNRERRALQQQMVAEAVAMVEERGDWRRRVSIVVGSTRWHPGVIGIVAAKLVERYYRPAFVMALGDPMARGSGRSIPGIHLVNVLEQCRVPLASFGGHRAAAGLTVGSADVGAFADAFEAVVRATTRPEHFIPSVDVDGEMRLGEATRELVEDLEVLEPTGPGNPAAVFVSRGVEVMDRRDVGRPDDATDGARAPHMKLVLRQDGVTADAIGFRMSALHAVPGERVDVVFTPRRNDWNGRRGVEFRLLDLRATR